MSGFRCPGTERIRASYPDEVPCACGGKVELWPDEDGARCPACGRTAKREIPPSCLDWCAAARGCVGEERYARYLRAKQHRAIASRGRR
ncbi:MAG: phosphohydrolase [Candidatus Aureabacteria bacterium]|nr:phosphohydrolase [Candidatus Auribacterota bacterium]NLW94528.1 phosphohydrolase [Chlamydiota bacterium]HOE26420.1 phosphohydrolase [bacterium]HQM53116.1 phosphohydrolase [bacterium]